MSHIVENDTSSARTSETIILFILISLGILFTTVPYIAELKRTCELPTDKPRLPSPVQACHWDANGLDLHYRNLALNTPVVVWLVLSVVITGMTRVFWYSESADSLYRCNTLNPDIAGIGVRVSLWVPGAIVMLIAGLGHFHAEETGVKSINVTLLVSQVIYGWNLWTKETSAVDQLVGAMIVDCLTFIT